MINTLASVDLGFQVEYGRAFTDETGKGFLRIGLCKGFLLAGIANIEGAIGEQGGILVAQRGRFLSLLSSTAHFTVSSIFFLSQGLGIKSRAPALIALTAFSVSTYAVMKSTTLLGLCFNILFTFYIFFV